MVPSIFLPHEVLANIFNNDCLSNGDLTRAQLACKIFRDNIKAQPFRKYIFRVDAVEHPTWRLVRHLLKNPMLGKRFIRITVEWRRRNIEDEETWTEDFQWDQDECERITALSKEANLSRKTRHNILRGKNSESLLPFLLLFTPNLKSLDLGKFNPDILDSPRFFKYSLAVRALGIAPVSRKNGVAAEGQYVTLDDKLTARSDIFLFDNIPPWEGESRQSIPKTFSNLLPGFTNLEHFQITGVERNACAERSFDVSSIFPIFFLPKIQRIEAFEMMDSRSGQVPKPPIGGVSSVKYLVLKSSRKCYTEGPYNFSRDFCKLIAKVTNNLKYVLIKNKWPECSENTSKDDEFLGRLFLQCNAKTLRPTHISINDGEFNEAGEYDEDREKRRKVAIKQRIWERNQVRLRRLVVSSAR
ncbi:hypothetical protein ABW20_dc0105589 [Dactylellina cionopaga]|nr:hypothetical protein ABW20_dc0105589 [Dactylellina cionopaga]